MAHLQETTMKVARRMVALAVIGLVLTSCSASSSTSSIGPAPVAIKTSDPLPSSLCGSDEGDDVNQSLNGDFTGCFRVPNVKSTSIVVSLDTDLFNTRQSSTSTTLTTSKSSRSSKSSNDRVSLSLSSSTVVPGQTVVVTGKLAKPVTQRQPNADLCWDGCNALQEQGVSVKWTSSTRFQMDLTVPETAWIVSDASSAGVHALTSGTYEVAVQCILEISGCALGRPDGQSLVTLHAPPTTKCETGHRCETMTLSTSAAPVGQEVYLQGWAPVQSVIGQPFGLNLSLTQVSKKKTYPAFAIRRLSKVAGFQVVFTPRTVRIGPGQPWSSLGRIFYESSTYSGASAVAPLNGSRRVAWCVPSGVTITGGQKNVDVATLGVRSALKGSGLNIFFRDHSPPQCAAVQLDPRFPNSVYGAFETAQGDSIPPVYLAPMYTTNAGATWNRVPIPKGASIESFGGISTQGDQVAALFEVTNNDSNRDGPQGTNNGEVIAEVTSDGGASWQSSTLGCPSTGPCTTFGPYVWGYCNMSDQDQALLVGPSGRAPSAGVHWTSSSWIQTVNSCFPQQLVASSSHELFLLDPSSQYPFLYSTDSGRSWRSIVLPTIPAANYGEDSIPIDNSLVLAPDGSLFAVITSPSGQTQTLYRLKPSATSWCELPHALGSSITVSGLVGPLRVNGADLIWSQTVTPTSGPSVMRERDVSFTSLSC